LDLSLSTAFIVALGAFSSGIGYWVSGLNPALHGNFRSLYCGPLVWTLPAQVPFMIQLFQTTRLDTVDGERLSH